MRVRTFGGGPPLLLVHGFPLDGTMWNPVIPALAQRWRVIVPDLRGFGQTPWPANAPPQTAADVEANRVTFSLNDFADDLAELLATLAIHGPITFCGLSMGGYIAFAFWRRHAKLVERLILCDTRAAADSPEAAAARRATAERVLREGTEFVAEAMLPKLHASAAFARDPAICAETHAVILRADPRAVAAASLAMAARPDSTGDLAGINVPTLVLCGEHDVISPPEEMAAWAKLIPNCRYVTIAGSGHMTTLENPADFAAAVNRVLD